VEVRSGTPVKHVGTVEHVSVVVVAVLNVCVVRLQRPVNEPSAPAQTHSLIPTIIVKNLTV